MRLTLIAMAVITAFAPLAAQAGEGQEKTMPATSAAASSASGVPSGSAAATPSFADFDRRAKAGERLSVVFFGASLTWGANASDPPLTSYRGNVANWLEAKYPQAHFTFHDAAIGGTGSQLGVFRFNRDVLAKKPDLIFLDFSANDSIYDAAPETMASYESLVRRAVVDAHAPLVIVIFPFRWDTAAGTTEKMKRRDAHIELAKAYNVPVGDAIELSQKLVKESNPDPNITLDKIWEFDGVHPGDAGYKVFADAAWAGFLDGIAKNMTCSAPAKMIWADTYMANARVRISSLGKLPQGWRVGKPNLVAAWFDGLMSRWLDDESICSNRLLTKDEQGKKKLVPQAVSPLKAKFNGSMVMLFGEETMKGGKYKVLIDGNVAKLPKYGSKTGEMVEEFETSGKKFNGNRQHAQLIATGLDATVDHTIEIVPLFSEKDEDETELRLESICVAGGKAKVWAAE